MTAAPTTVEVTHSARMVFPILDENAALGDLRATARTEFLAAIHRARAIPLGRITTTIQHGEHPAVIVAGQAWAPGRGAVELT